MSRSGGGGHSSASLAASFSSGEGGAIPAGGVRYKAVTRDVLQSVCRKHFVMKAVGGGTAQKVFKSGTVAAQLAYASQHGGDGFDYQSSEPQSKLETLERYLKRATHLQLDNLKLTHIMPNAEQALGAGHGHVPTDTTLTLAKAVRVIYLNNNYLTSLDPLLFCAQTLSHLYVQNNALERLTNLLPLRNLEKLYAGNNCIQVLEGFAAEESESERQRQQQQQHDQEQGGQPQGPQPFYLVELHMEAQRLPEGVPLQLSVPSMQALSYSLTILSLQGNQMNADAILPLSLLTRLVQLNLAQNAIEDLVVVGEMCGYLHDLARLDLRDNPINTGPHTTAVTHKKYRDRVIMSARSIVMLDDKEVPTNQREYLHALKEQKRIKKAAAAAAASAPRELTDEEKKFAALHAPPLFKYAPKVLTLRTTQTMAPSHSGHGATTINIGMMGGMGASAGHALHASPSTSSVGRRGNSAPYDRQHAVFQATSSSSPFADEDENLGGGGGRGGGGDYFQRDQQQPFDADPQQHSHREDEGTATSMTFTGDPRRLNNLLQQRGLVSAFGAGMTLRDDQPIQPSSVESARVRRASMNSLNQAQNGQSSEMRSGRSSRPPICTDLSPSVSLLCACSGWDGGRTTHLPVINHHQRKDSSSPPRASNSRTANRSNSNKSPAPTK